MKMKNYLNRLLYALIGAFLFVACQKNNQAVNQSVEGTYIGNITSSTTLKNALAVDGNRMDTAIVKQINNGQVNVHCFGNDLDSTFILNIYHNGDSLMVCLTGSSFEHEYGHMMGQGSKMGGGNMMGNNSTEWGKHMNGEHKSGDEHFGGFNMPDNTFGYSFKMMDGNSVYYKKFQGTKK